jgi:hypothetical protein
LFAPPLKRVGTFNLLREARVQLGRISFQKWKWPRRYEAGFAREFIKAVQVIRNHQNGRVEKQPKVPDGVRR